MTTAVKEEIFELNRNVAGITERDLAAKTADGSLVPVWEYPVPVGEALVFDSKDVFSAYLEDEGVPAECVGSGVVAAVKVDIVIMDSSKQNVRSILNMLQYGDVTDFTDEDKLAHLDIAPGEQVIAREQERVCIRVNCPGAVATLDASASYFRLTCKRVRHTLFA